MSDINFNFDTDIHFDSFGTNRNWIRIPPLTAAVNVLDTYTRQQAFGELDIFVNGLPLNRRPNPSGYYMLHDEPGNILDIQVISEYYFEYEKQVNIVDLDPSSPVVNIPLSPMPSYPFPGTATLIRGFVTNSNGYPVRNAQVRAVDVELDGKPVQSFTNSSGEFVLWFTGLTNDDVVLIKEEGKRFIKGKGLSPVMLELDESEPVGLEPVDPETLEIGPIEISPPLEVDPLDIRLKAKKDSRIGTTVIRRVEEGRVFILENPILLPD